MNVPKQFRTSNDMCQYIQSVAPNKFLFGFAEEFSSGGAQKYHVVNAFDFFKSVDSIAGKMPCEVSSTSRVSLK